MYARRRTRDAFHEHQHESDPRRIQEFMQKGLKELQMMKVSMVVLDLEYGLASKGEHTARMPFYIKGVRTVSLWRILS